MYEMQQQLDTIFSKCDDVTDCLILINKTSDRSEIAHYSDRISDYIDEIKREVRDLELSTRIQGERVGQLSQYTKQLELAFDDIDMELE
jgi:hypothetical protein